MTKALDNERSFAWSPEDDGSTITEALAFAIYEGDTSKPARISFDAWVAAVLDTEGVA